jgi:hypothetical protein
MLHEKNGKNNEKINNNMKQVVVNTSKISTIKSETKIQIRQYNLSWK